MNPAEIAAKVCISVASALLDRSTLGTGWSGGIFVRNLEALQVWLFKQSRYVVSVVHLAEIDRKPLETYI